MCHKRILHVFFALTILTCSNSCEVEGPAGLNSLVNIVAEAPGSNCKAGGVRIESGLDNNRDASLSLDEIAQVQYVCNGANGSISAVVSEAAGSNCMYGGFKIATGIDTNINQMLDASEINSTQYICATGTD